MKDFFSRVRGETGEGLNLLFDVDIATYVQSQMFCGVVCRLSLLTAIQGDTEMATTYVALLTQQGEVAGRAKRSGLQIENKSDSQKYTVLNNGSDSQKNSAEHSGTRRNSSENYCVKSVIENGAVGKNGRQETLGLYKRKVDTFDDTLGSWCDDNDSDRTNTTDTTSGTLYRYPLIDKNNGEESDVDNATSKADKLWDGTVCQDLGRTENWENEVDYEGVPYQYDINLDCGGYSTFSDEFSTSDVPVAGSSMDSADEEVGEDSPTGEREYELVTCNPRKVYISNVAFRTSQRRLWSFFDENFGPVEYCQLLKDKWNHSKGRGFVTFKTLESAEKIKAAEDDRLMLDKRVLKAEQATWKKYKPRWEDMRDQSNNIGPWSCDHNSEKPDTPEGSNAASDCNVNEASTTSDRSKVVLTALDPLSHDHKSHDQPVNRLRSSASDDIQKNHVDTSLCISVCEDCDNGVLPVQGVMDSLSSDVCTTKIHTLNDYVLLHILAYLPLAKRVQCERVCKKWQAVCSTHWQSLKQLSLTGQIPRYTVFTDQVLKRLFKWGCPTLEYLDLSSVSRTLTSACVHTIGKNCPNLKKINLAGMTLNQKSLRSLSEACRNIEWISLRNCHDVGEKGMWSLFVNCKQLRHLDLADNRRINGKCFHVAGHHVTTLDLSDCVQLSDDGLKKLADRWKLLQELHLSGALNITNVGFRPLCESLTSLRVLSLCGTISGVSTVGLRSLSELHQLEELDLNRNNSVDDSVISAVAYYCTRLRKLDLTLCGEGVSDAALCALAFSPVLEELDVSYLINVISRRPDLVLKETSPPMIEENGLTQISANGKLRKLVARGCSAITEQAFISVVTLCPFLSHLDVCGCGQVTVELVSVCVSELLKRKNGRMDLDRDSCLDLHIGGTSVSREDLPPIPEGLLSVDHYNLCIDYLRPDRELFFGDMMFDDDEDDFSDEFHDYMDLYDFDDDFMDQDDPLLAERFMMS